MNTHRIILGDCLTGLKTLGDQSVNTCVTSPPYFGLRDYKGGDAEIGCEASPEDFVRKMVEVFREVHRVLRDDGTVWLNLGDSYARDSGKSPTVRHTDGREKNFDPSEALRPQASTWGGKPKDLVGIPWRVAFALQADGWYLRQDIIWHKPNPMPESVEDRCTKAHEYIFLLSKKPKYYFDHEAIKEPLADASIGRAKRKQSLIDRKGVGTLGKQIQNGVDPKHGYAGLAMGRNGKTGYSDDGKRNKRSVWTVTTKPFRGAHFATFPLDLITPCVLAGCPEGGTVLDPFTGSGTTAVAALTNRRNFVGCELNPEYAKLAEDRIKAEVPNTLEGIMQ